MKGLQRVAGIWLFLSLAVSAPPPAAGQPAGAPGKASAESAASSFGKKVSFALLQDYPKGEDLDQVLRDFRLMKELGITTWRGSFSWIDYEPERGKFDLAWLRAFLDLALREGITLRPYLAYTPAWAAGGGGDKQVWNDPPRSLGDWSGFVSRIASETKGYRNIASFEIYNEENVKEWWDGKAGDYNKVLRAGAVAVKTVVPATQVIFGGMVYPDEKWVEAACIANGNAKSFDVLPFHAYPETWTPKNITVENYLDQGYTGFFLGKFIPTVDEKCARQPVWINEAGFATAPGKTEKEQANWWARAIATFLADPRVEHLGIYQVRDRKKSESVIGESENYYLGILRSDGHPKLAFHLLKRLVPLMNTGYITVADPELAVEVAGGRKGELYRHLFVRPDGRQVLFVWDRTGSPTLCLRPRPGSSVTEYRLDGTTKSYAAYDGKRLDDVRLEPGIARIFEIAP
jgi:polysaccharide biosynthesis protein PslG